MVAILSPAGGGGTENENGSADSSVVPPPPPPPDVVLVSPFLVWELRAREWRGGRLPALVLLPLRLPLLPVLLFEAPVDTNSFALTL